jgi:GntR family transcriptional regulator
MSDLPLLQVRTTDPTPPYEQLRRQFADLIGSGVLAPGDRLPPLRQLAADLGLAVGTVARTYRELESVGLIRSRRGGGTRVAPAAGHPRDGAAALRRSAEEFVRRAQLLGAQAADIHAAVDDVLASRQGPALPG